MERYRQLMEGVTAPLNGVLLVVTQHLHNFPELRRSLNQKEREADTTMEEFPEICCVHERVVGAAALVGLPEMLVHQPPRHQHSCQA
mmetsp:Transcript_44055/g.79246  ORF Transcript_44055/g.79246 Transcript_44055/m.79246 type:complete len:87 (-) Transcript_44055:482-742(-)